MPAVHKIDCKCPFCCAKRGELGGSKNPFYGKNHTEEVKRILSVKAMFNSPMRGKNHSKETIEKMKKMRNDPMYIKKQSDDQKLRWKNLEYRSRQTTATGKHWTVSKEVKDRRRELMKNKWQNPEYRKKMEVGGRGKKGYFYSFKNSCSLFYASGYELQAYLNLEKDPFVFKYGRCNFIIHYIIDGMAHTYRPDIMIEYFDGIKKIIEVKSIWEINNKERNRVIISKMTALHEYCIINNLEYEMWTEKEIFKKGDKNA